MAEDRNEFIVWEQMLLQMKCWLLFVDVALLKCICLQNHRKKQCLADSRISWVINTYLYCGIDTREREKVQNSYIFESNRNAIDIHTLLELGNILKANKLTFVGTL